MSTFDVRYDVGHDCDLKMAFKRIGFALHSKTEETLNRALTKRPFKKDDRKPLKRP